MQTVCDPFDAPCLRDLTSWHAVNRQGSWLAAADDSGEVQVGFKLLFDVHRAERNTFKHGQGCDTNTSQAVTLSA